VKKQGWEGIKIESWWRQRGAGGGVTMDGSQCTLPLFDMTQQAAYHLTQHLTMPRETETIGHSSRSYILVTIELFSYTYDVQCPTHTYK